MDCQSVNRAESLLSHCQNAPFLRGFLFDDALPVRTARVCSTHRRRLYIVDQLLRHPIPSLTEPHLLGCLRIFWRAVNRPGSADAAAAVMRLVLGILDRASSLKDCENVHSSPSGIDCLGSTPQTDARRASPQRPAPDDASAGTAPAGAGLSLSSLALERRLVSKQRTTPRFRTVARSKIPNT